MDDKTLARFWSKVDRNGPVLREELGPCWVWTASREAFGYGWFRYQGRPHLAHRIAWLIQQGQVSELCVLHKCDGGHIGCVRPDHLFEGTRKDNNKDRSKKGRSSPPAIRCINIRGEGHPNARLTPESIIKIRAAAVVGVSYSAIASQFGISTGYVSDIVNRLNWRHLP